MFGKRNDQTFGCFSNVYGVRFNSSRWGKASKCKRHIENILCLVNLHRKRRECLVKQSRSDIAILLPKDCFSEALSKTKQFYEDERRILAYDQVEYFCTSILQNFPLLKRQDNIHLLPDETKEAIAGLIFAASRIGEVQELQYVRSLLVQRFGVKFDKDTIELRPGNLVSSKIIKILDTKTSLETVMETTQKQQEDLITEL